MKALKTAPGILEDRLKQIAQFFSALLPETGPQTSLKSNPRNCLSKEMAKNKISKNDLEDNLQGLEKMI